MDYGSRYTDITMARLKKRIDAVFLEAQKDIDAKIEDFNRRFKTKEAIRLKELKEGKISQDDFDSWMRGQVFQSQQWLAKRDQIAGTLTNYNKVAMSYINSEKLNVFAANANYMSYNMEHGMGVNFGFGVYDSSTVMNLVFSNPKLLPEWKIDEVKDYTWNYDKVKSAVTQGIIQGEKLEQISKRLTEGLCAKNKNHMLTFARTAMTGAQNSGRDYQIKEAQKLGIDIEKEWMATLDSTTRDSHRAIDGERRNPDDAFSNTLMYPGDPWGPPKEVYNCRCTMVSNIKKYPDKYTRYDNIDGKPIANMTYTEWYNAKMGITQVDSFQTQLGRAKTVDEVNALMNKQDWFKVMSGWGGGIRSQADLTGCDLDSAKSIAAAYEQMFEKYPQLKGMFEAPDAHPVGMKEYTYAWCHLQTGKVQVNPASDKYGNWSALSKQYESDVKIGFHPKGTTPESIIIHEIGHAIDALLARRGILGGMTASGEYRYASSSLRSTIMKRAAKLDSDVADYFNIWGNKDGMTYAVNDFVSEYATKNPKEWFAECFAEYITSAKPRLIATEFGKELERLLSKL